MFHFGRAFLSNQSGATAIEYGGIAMLISLAAMVALDSVGASVVGFLHLVTGSL